MRLGDINKHKLERLPTSRVIFKDTGHIEPKWGSGEGPSQNYCRHLAPGTNLMEGHWGFIGGKGGDVGNDSAERNGTRGTNVVFQPMGRLFHLVVLWKEGCGRSKKIDPLLGIKAKAEFVTHSPLNFQCDRHLPSKVVKACCVLPLN